MSRAMKRIGDTYFNRWGGLAARPNLVD
jgi:hypothetical protein